MRKVLFTVMSVALLAACNSSPKPLPEPEINFEAIENCAEEDVEVMDNYFYYFFEADSLLQRELEISLRDTTVVLDYAVLPFQIEPVYKYQLVEAIDEMVFNLGKDSVESLILHHNRDFQDSLENRLQEVEFRMFTLNTIVDWENEDF